MREPEAAFWSWVDRDSGHVPQLEGWEWQGGPCWLWRGNVAPDTGYGRFGANTAGAGFAHRFAYHVQCGPLDGLDVHHLCGERLCVRGSHLALRPRGRHVAERLRF